jgi:primary-amine oxidase
MTTARHPLDPLDSDEIDKAAGIVKRDGGLDVSAWFETISLDEPRGEAGPSRRAYVCCYEPTSNRTFAGIADLDADRLNGWRQCKGEQARIPPEEFAMACDIARADPAFVAALEERGICDPSKVLVEGWAAGNFGVPEEEGRRLAYGHCWLMNEAGDNPYARPIANLHPVFDLAAGKIIRIDDFGVVPLPPDPGPIRRDNPRPDLKEISITQPEGPSFDVDGYAVRWQKWHVRIGYSLREGLVLHDIGYEDKGCVRPIMKRASMAEMVVPYGDPSGGNFRRNAFDTGEYGIGNLLDSLALGCDCLGYIRYFDVWTHDWHGTPRMVKNAVCMHEEDFGIGWKFSVVNAGQTSVTRSRRLVISSICTIGNYVYGFFWYFYLDGTIGVEIKATGIPFPSGIAPDTASAYGELVAPGVDSHVHQHVFSFRFDMAVDGERNSVKEVDFAAMPTGPDNPHGNGIAINERLLARESEAQREMDFGAARYWKVINPNSLNRLGAPVGYKLVPGVNAMPFQHPDSPVGRRAGFMYKHLWVTQYAPGELYPAGWFPNQHAGGDGLPKWVQADRSVDNQDIVVWYTLNYHHLPRPEDWPVQPTVYAGFHWMPSGFFDENPAMDVPLRKT